MKELLALTRRRALAKDRILEYLQSIDRPVSPHEIAVNLKINPKTVSTALLRLTYQGAVIRETRGLYRSNPIYGVGGAAKPIRIQNLHVVGTGTTIRNEDAGRVDAFEYPDVSGETFRVRITYGMKRNKIAYTCRAMLGLDRYGFLLLHEYVKAKISLRGYDTGLSWVVVNYELLQDFVGIKVDGAKSITLDAFDSMLIKVYEKSYGLRKEVRGSKPAQLNDLLALTMGGIPTYQLMQGVGANMKGLEDLTRAISALANRQYDSQKIQIAQTEALTRLLDALYNQGLVKPSRDKA